MKLHNPYPLSFKCLLVHFSSYYVYLHDSEILLTACPGSLTA
jgi:hypothetical protein